MFGSRGRRVSVRRGTSPADNAPLSRTVEAVFRRWMRQSSKGNDGSSPAALFHRACCPTALRARRGRSAYCAARTEPAGATARRGTRCAPAQIHAELRLTEMLCAISPASDTRLAVPSLTIDALGDEPLILAWLQKSGVRLALERSGANGNLVLNDLMEVESGDVAAQVVADGAGWTVHVASVPPVRGRASSRRSQRSRPARLSSPAGRMDHIDDRCRHGSGHIGMRIVPGSSFGLSSSRKPPSALASVERVALSDRS